MSPAGTELAQHPLRTSCHGVSGQAAATPHHQAAGRQLAVAKGGRFSCDLEWGVMNRRVLLCAGLLLAAAYAVAEPPPLLWAEGGEGRLWLYGSIHLPMPESQALPPEVREAIEAADVVLTEIPLDPVAQMRAYRASLLPEGRSLTDNLPGELLARLETELAARGLRLGAFSRLRPWALAGQLAMLDESLTAGALPVDMRIWSLAGRLGKQTAGLETVDEQIAAMEALGPEGQNWLLNQALDELRRAREGGYRAAEPLVRAWRSGKLEALARVLEEQAPTGDPVGRIFREEVLDKRNHRMVERILDRLRTEPDRRLFVAVGALHLAGREGLVALLDQQGRHLEQVPAPSSPTLSEETTR